MRTFKMLVLTDHTNHSAENSLYPLVKAMRLHPRCGQIDVATRGNVLNDPFFKELLVKPLLVTKVDEGFIFNKTGHSFERNVRRESLEHYDVIWLRMPPPLSNEFLNFLTQRYPGQLIINSPTGIRLTGSKIFLINFPDLCAPMKLCRSLEDIIAFKNQFPIVLKPFREYGGKGIVRIEGEKVWEGKKETSFNEFKETLKNAPIEYLGVKFLKNVSKGDKRIVVIDGEIMGASLRLPATNSWICNVAMGGQSNPAQADEDEIKIIQRLNPTLNKMGIVKYGVDTLVGDDGKRVLSEINTTSIGGLPQIAKQTQLPILEKTADLLWNYIDKKIIKDAVTN